MQRPIQAYRLFFPAATLFALGAIPVWALEYAGFLPAVRGGGSGSWHGHEMVFGYAFAVIAGYLLTKISREMLVAVFVLWLLGRGTYLFLPLPPFAEAAIAVSFPLSLFVFAGAPFLRAAKTWRNAVFVVVLGGLVVAALAYQSGVLGALAAGQARGVGLGVNIVTLLMFTMGGRVIAAATSGALQEKGTHLHGVAQPRLEQAGVVAIIALALFDFWGYAPYLAAAAALAGAAVVGLRLFRWQIWKVTDHADLLSLHIGYAWLAVGLAMQSAALGFRLPVALRCPAWRDGRRPRHAVARNDGPRFAATQPTADRLPFLRLAGNRNDFRRRAVPVSGGVAGLAPCHDCRGKPLLDACLRLVRDFSLSGAGDARRALKRVDGFHGRLSPEP